MRVIISGGGTGGHIYPAIAIADAIKMRWPDAEIHFVGASGRMEMQKVPQAGYSIDGLWISGFQRKSSLKNLLLPFKLISSLWKSWRIIRRFKPDIAIGVGGYASGPLLFMASRLKVRTMIQEQNSYPGMTNRLLRKAVDHICVAFDGMENHFPSEKITRTGNPVRNLNLADDKRADAYQHFGLSQDKKTILLVGGSLGSLRINQAMANSLALIQRRSDIQWIWQIGDFYMNRFEGIPSALESNVVPLRFIERMDFAYKVADLVVCRAGALTLSEVALCGKAVIVVPSPNVSEDHQTKNARSLVDDRAAVMVADQDLVHRFETTVETLIDDPQRLTELEGRIQKWAQPDATMKILDVIESLTE